MQFATVFECGGTERQVLNLGRALRARGADVAFGCLRRAGRLLGELDGAGIDVREYHIRSLYSVRAAREMLALAHDLSRARTDVLHAYNIYGNVFAVPAARLAGVPVVIAGVRDCGLYMDPWKKRVQRAICRLADLILVNAVGVKDWLVSEGYAAARIRVVHNGIDVARFEDVRPAGSVRQELGIPAEAPILTLIARLCPSKGVEPAIDAMAELGPRHADAHLLVVGEALRSERGDLTSDDRYRRQLEARAHERGVGDRVHFLGYRADVPALLAQASLSVQPSLTEGLSNSILEAMASARAVVATPVGGTPEIIVPDRTGVLVPPGDPRALAAAIGALLDSPARREDLGHRARALVHERFSIRALADATERIYREQLEAAPARWRPTRAAVMASR